MKKNANANAAKPALVPRPTTDLTPEAVAALEPIDRVLAILTQADLQPKPTRENAHELVHAILAQYVQMREQNKKLVSVLNAVDMLVQTAK